VAENAERGVIFNLKANVDAQAKTNVDAFFESIIGGQAKVNSAVDSVAVTTQSQVKATIEKMANELGQAQERVVADASAIAQKTAESNRTIQTESAASAEQFASKAKIANASVAESQEKTAKEIVESWTNSYTASSVAAEKAAEESVDTVKESAKSIAERIRELEGEKTQIRKISADAERADYIHAQLALVDITRRRIEAEDALIEAQDREESKRKIRPLNDNVIRLRLDELEVEKEIAKKKKIFLEAEKKEKAALVEQELKGLKSIAAEQEKVASIAASRNEQIGRSVGRVVSAFSEGSEALMRFANGFKYLGLVGEKDLQKLTDALLTIQGTTQVFTGAIRLVRQASEGYDAYRKVVLLTAEAHVALTAAQSASAASGAAAAAGAGGSTMGRMATGAAGIGARLGMAAETVGIAAGGAGLTIFAGALAAASGALFATVSAVDTFRNALKFGAGGGAAEGSLTQTIGTSSMNPFARAMGTGSAIEAGQTVARGLLDPFNLFGLKGKTTGEKQAEDEKKNIDRLAQIQATRAEQQRRDEEDLNKIVSERSAIEMQRAAIERETMQHRLGAMAAEERRARIVEEISSIENDSTLTAEQRAKQMIQFSTQRLSVEREISAERMRSAQETLAAAKQELQTKEQQLKSAQDAALSAQERFGLLSAEEQQQLLASQKQFAAGAQGVGVEDLRKLRGFSGAMDEQIASEARRRAQAAGFGAFQAEDVKRIQQLETERQQIEVKVKAQAQVVATLEVDSKKVAAEINKQIDAQYGIILKTMAEQIGMTSAKVKEIEDGMRNRLTRI
jgi:hypothetical protein